MSFHVVDSSERFSEQTLRMRTTRSRLEDRFIATWQSYLASTSQVYDLILSDLTSGNIDYEEREAFYRSIHNALRVGGIFVDKVLTNEPGYEPLDLLDQRFGSPGVSIQSLNDFSCAYFFTSELAAASGIVDVDGITRYLRERYADSDLPQRVLLDYTHLLTPSGSSWYYGRSWYEVKQSYCPWTEPNELLREAHGVYANRLSIFASVRRT